MVTGVQTCAFRSQVHMYADKMTDSMRTAIDETNRRREIQQAYNREHGLDPQPLRKKIADITDVLAREEEDTRELLQLRKARRPKSCWPASTPGRCAIYPLPSMMW